MKISKDYEEAVVDVVYIINNMEDEEKNKIPKSLIDLFLNISSSSNYVSNINAEIPLYKQELKPKTKALLGLLYRQFLCSDSERLEFDNIIQENDRKYKGILADMYGKDIEDVFKSRQNRKL